MTDREFEQCMSAMAAGDRDSLRHIYDAYLKLIYAVVYDAIGQREEAEDVDRKSTRLNSSHPNPSRMPSSA